MRLKQLHRWQHPGAESAVYDYDERVSLSVSLRLSVRTHISRTTRRVCYLRRGQVYVGWFGSRVVSVKACVQIAAATLSGNSLRQIVYAHRASVHQAAKLVATLCGLAESNGSLPPGL